MILYRSIPLLLVACCFALLTGCHAVDFVAGPATVGSGTLIKEAREVTDFRRLRVESIADVTCSQGDQFSIEVEADDNIMPLVITEVEGDSLLISLAKGRYENVTCRVHVIMPAFNGANISGVSKLHLTGWECAEPVQLTVSGVSKVDGKLFTGSLNVSASGTSQVNITGAAESLELEALGTSKIDLAELPASTVNAEASGVSSITVLTDGTLNANASGSSKISYFGSPQAGSRNTSGVSSIKPAG